MATIRQVTYAPLDAPLTPVEVMSYERLRALNHGETLRADFCVVGIVEAGVGSISIDFAIHELTERTAVWVPPGAVHRWADIGAIEGLVVLFVPTVLVTLATRAHVTSAVEGAVWTVDAADWSLVLQGVRHLESESGAQQNRADSKSLGNDLPALLVSALIARLQPPHMRGRQEGPLLQSFRALVEQNFRTQHDAVFYARNLGYDPRTLSRATRRVLGITAKDYVGERIVLEAKRLLAHDGFTAARVAGELGFSSASSFSVFFLNATAQRPGMWQRQQQGRPST